MRRPRTVALLSLAMALAWSLAVAANPIPSDAEAATYWRFFIATIGAAVGVMTLIGLGMTFGARYVSEPSARKILKEHLDLGEKAHESLMPREKWDRKHDELKAEVDHLKVELAALSVRIDTKAPLRR